MMNKYEFKDKLLEEEYRKREERLLKLASDPVNDSLYIWNETVRKYGTTMERVKRVLLAEGMEVHEVEGLLKNINSFLKQCSRLEFHIALVGAIKAGKSTLINSLLGYEYASTKVTPETAALTKFRKADKDYIKVSFYTESEWEKVWNSANESKARVFLEEYAALQADREKSQWIGKKPYQEVCENREDLKKTVEKWTSSKSPVHYFVKEVEVGLNEFELPEGVVLVDTPGLDDIVEYRSNITKRYIESANAVLVCVKADALTGQEMATIYATFSNKRNNPECIYIIATQTDTLNRPVEDWKMQREEWLKHLKGKGAYNSLELAEKNLLDVSAYFYMLLKSFSSLDEDDDKMWDLQAILAKLRIRKVTPDQYKNLLDLTHIDFLKNKLTVEIIEKRKEILVCDIKNHYEACKETILTYVRQKRANQEELLAMSQKNTVEIEKKYREVSEKLKEAEADKNDLESIIKKFEFLAEQKASELEKTIKSLGRK